MDQRSYQERRHDSSTAERFDMAVRTALAFDQGAAYSYLAICGVRNALTSSPPRAVASLPWHTSDRRAESMQRAY